MSISATARPRQSDAPPSADHCKLIADVDIAVVGGGIVGCAVARRMTLAGASVVLVEKGSDILSGASKGNSAILHTGFDAPPDSLEWHCMREGYEEYLAIHKGLNLPLLKSGALVVAWTPEQEARLDGILEQGRANRVGQLQMLTREQTLALESNLSPRLRAAIRVPGEYLIDPWSAAYAYLLQAVKNGARALFSTTIKGGIHDGRHWYLNSTRGELRARHVINCAGLYGDILDQAALGDSGFQIKPRKGQFVVFDKAAHHLIRNIVLPVPSERTKGIVLFPTVFGNLAVGPTAEEQESRNDASVDRETLEMLIGQGVSMLPALAHIPVTATYAGIRPASERKEYRIRSHRAHNWITVGGIRSTGLTAALGIARHVQRLLEQQSATFRAITEPLLPRVPNLAEHLPRDCHSPGYGEIVCHCEMVTRREIEAALTGELPANSLGALKRRTRATMGRCQGFYCSARLAELTAGHFQQPLAVGESDDE